LALLIVAGFLLASFFHFTPVRAQSDIQAQTEAFAGPEGAGFVESNQQQPEDPRYLFGLFIRVAFGFLAIAMVGYLIYGGYLVMTSGGQEEKMTKGKKTLFTAILGSIIILSAYSITIYVFKIAKGESGWEEGIHVRPDETAPRDIRDQRSDRDVLCWWIFC